ncbi:MAG: hypothetical protein GX372_07600 [Ignavibacteria bacterium]|nr:hypothetical protein [Ignavibacteria bacterium]
MKKTQKLLKAIAAGAAGIALSLALNLDANAQNLTTNSGGFTNHGTLRMVSADGTITGVGTSATDRIGGIVEWARKGDQAVQGLYYTNLLLSYRYPNAGAAGNTTKTFAGNQSYFVNGWYEKHSTTPGVSDDGNYTLTYNASSTFVYDGDSPQTILGSGKYGILRLTGNGEKRIFALHLATDNPPFGAGSGTSNKGTQLAAGNVEATTMNSDASAALLVSGNGGAASLDIAGGILNGAVDITGNGNGSATIITSNGTGTDITFNAAVEINGAAGNEGKIDINGAGNVNIGSTGTLTLGDANSVLDMATGSHLNIDGTIANHNTGDPTNLRLDNSGTGSTITYTGATSGQTALSTSADNPYSHVVIGGTVGLAGDAYVAGGMELQTGGEFNTIKGSATPGSINVNDYNKIVFTTETANLVNENDQDCGEVRGIVARSAWDMATTYRFNNVATTLQFGALPAPTGQEVGFFILPGQAPTFRDDQWSVAPSQIGDQEGQVHIIPRHIQAYTQGGHATIVAGSLAMGYTSGERGTAGFEPDKGYRTFEGQSTTNADLLSTGTETVSPQCFYVAQATSVTRFGEAAYSNLATDVATSSQLLITQNAAAVIASVRNGRWSDPETWNVGAQPISSDFVELSHKVWTGDGIGFLTTTNHGGTPRKYARAEHQGAGVNNLGSAYQLAAKVTLLPAVTTGDNLTPGGGLFIGQAHAGNPGGAAGETGVANDGIYTFGLVINNNNQTASGSFASTLPGTGLPVGALQAGTGTLADGLHGIYIAPDNDNNIFRATTLNNNSGSATNFGIAEIGSD